MPFHRLQHLQKFCGTPLAASTAWHQCETIWLGGGEAVYEALLTLAAQSKLLHVDDTGAKILSVIAENKNLSQPKKGCHTTLVRGKTAQAEEMVVYMTGTQTAGYKLGSVLTKRQFPHHRLNLMSDASTMNTICIEGKADQRFLAQLEQGYCLSHGILGDPSREADKVLARAQHAPWTITPLRKACGPLFYSAKTLISLRHPTVQGFSAGSIV